MGNAQILQIARAAAKGGPTLAKLKKATQDIEAIFVKDLLAAMRKTAPRQKLGNGLGSDLYQDLFDQALSQAASKSGSLGLGKTIYQSMAPVALRAALSAVSGPAAKTTLLGSETLPARREQKLPEQETK
jgi:Rod binding domain-containing protein